MVPVAAFLATRGYRGTDAAPSIARRPWPPLCILPAYGAQCYGDIGFQSLTCGLIFGVAMARGREGRRLGGGAP